MNKWQGVPEHVFQTVAYLDEKIKALTDMRAGLLAFWPTLPVAEPEPAVAFWPALPVAKPEPTPANPPAPPKPSGKVKPARRQRAASGRNLGAGLKLREPFTAKDLARALKLTKNGAVSQIMRWLSSRRVKRVGVGLYARTALYPGAPPPAPRVRVPGLDEPDLTTQQRLAAAEYDLQQATANGHQSLMRILNDKVRGLRARLDEERKETDECKDQPKR